MRNFGFLILCLFSLLLYLLPSELLADNDPPKILNVEIVSDMSDQNSDTVPPVIGDGSMNYSPKFQLTDSSGRVDFDNNVIAIVGNQLYVTVVVSDSLSGVDKVLLDISNSENENKIVDLAYTYSNYWSTTISFSNEDVGFWEINKITAVDKAGNETDTTQYQGKFYVLPQNYILFNSQLLETSDTNHIIKISFSKEMDSTTFNKENILLFDGSQVINDFTITVSQDNKKVYIQRENGYKYHNNYFLILHDSITDKEGSKISNPMFFKFKGFN